ncbi:hypothetical protein [Thermoflexus sp.]|uniref:hypothetical protein n=1 Tax=Thermoflexus sp. TaxID=1969742 RepID=UPI002ADE8E59|nr:hypothetical protein [Thermoflexus sp.]
MVYCVNCDGQLLENELLAKDVHTPHGAVRVYFCPHCHAWVRDEVFFDFNNVARLGSEKIIQTPKGWEVRFERREAAWSVGTEGDPILMVLQRGDSWEVEESPFWFAEIRAFTMRLPPDCKTVAVFHRALTRAGDWEKFYIVYEFDPPVKYFLTSKSREEDLSPVGKALFRRLTAVVP